MGERDRRGRGPGRRYRGAVITGVGLLGLIGVIGMMGIVLTLVTDRSDSEAFGRYLGNVPPVAVVIGVSALAYPVLRFLHDLNWALWDDGWLALLFVVVGAALLAAFAITADLVLRFPEDMNVPSPRARTVVPGMVTFGMFHDPAGNLVGLVEAETSAGESSEWGGGLAVLTPPNPSIHLFEPDRYLTREYRLISYEARRIALASPVSGSDRV